MTAYWGTFDGRLAFLPDKVNIIRYSQLAAQWQHHIDAGVAPDDAVVKVAESYGVDNGTIGGILEHLGLMKWWVA